VYPSVPPFHPSEAFPELPLSSNITRDHNGVYAAVREAFHRLNLDIAQFGTSGWNPLGGIIKPGDRVAVKPNFVLHFNSSGGDITPVVTHGSVLRAVLDYVVIALKGSGSITVGDAPHGNADFDRIVDVNGAREVVEYFREKGIVIELVDFRKYRYGYGEEGFLKETKTPLPGDPRGYSVVDLGKESELENLPFLERLYGADYDRSIIREHHRPGRHEYLIANSILRANVVVSVPKLKVHSKAGVTINLKNLVGINGDKNWLPHYRIGYPENGGDEFPRSSMWFENFLRRTDRWLVDILLSRDTVFRKLLYRVFLKVYYPAIGLITRATGNSIHRGNWNGNDTVWRMVLDLNKILLYAAENGRLNSSRQRKFLSVVDGIIAGEGNGPLGPSAKNSGVIIAGFSPLLVDLIGARLMGFSLERIPLFWKAFRDAIHPLAPCNVDGAEVYTNVPALKNISRQSGSYLNFSVPYGWREDRSLSATPSNNQVDETTIPEKFPEQ